MSNSKITIADLMQRDFKDLSAELDFEQAIALMEELTHSVESGNLPLAKSITAYEKGTELLKYLDELLGDAEQKLNVEQVN